MRDILKPPLSETANTFDFHPTVIVDARLHEHLSELDVNVNAITNTFVEEGMTADQVLDTTILITANKPDAGPGIVGYARYIAKKRQIELYPDSRIKRAVGEFQNAEGYSREFMRDKAGKYFGYNLSEHLRHEMEHRIVDAQGGMPEQILHKRRMYAKAAGIIATTTATNLTAMHAAESVWPSQSMVELAAKTVGISALSGLATLGAIILRGRHYYATSPEEKRAYDAQELEIGEHWPFITTRFHFQDANPSTA